jgi:DNA-binding SARP family transcriptional activator/Tfp pilus assembly protein PilF
MEANVVGSVEMRVESTRPSETRGAPRVAVRMFGTLTILRDDVALALPASRKVRALFAYLALAPHGVARGQLCELLWEVPNDPRGELRWCLSKIRSVIDEPDRRRVVTESDTIRLDLDDCSVDAIDVPGAAAVIETLSPARLRHFAGLFRGDFLDGLEIDRSPAFSTWLAAQRRRFRACHAALLERLVRTAPDDDVIGYLGTWLELAPFDPAVHAMLFDVLARHGKIREGEEHLAATIRLFESEGLDGAPIRVAWRSVRAQGETAPLVAVDPAPTQEGVATASPRRASIAVMPFADRSVATSVRGGAADALAHDVITRLAKLRSLFVIAQGTVFALHERQIAPQEAARMLNVDYVVSGTVQRLGSDLTVIVELAETRSARIVWAERFHHRSNDTFQVLDEIGNRIVASIASEIEAVERNRAVLRPPNSLDAWEAYHRGLWHMYRFNRDDNAQAQHFLQMAVRLDPTFSRAHAGLSFTYFQNAFQGWEVRAPQVEQAYAAAAQSLMVDARDPAAHWAMGRALWLRGQHGPSIVELDQAIALSPNFALGHYTLAFVQSQAGDPQAAIASADHARALSPFDPMLFGMFGARAMALARLGRFEEAAEWGVKAAARPNAHAHILAIAAFSLALAGRVDEGRAYVATIHKALPSYRVDDFLTAMQFGPEGERLYRKSTKLLGL